ncbi:hypothetical protein BDW75DRAFT_197642 [Aspergillus navahoensis]
MRGQESYHLHKRAVRLLLGLQTSMWAGSCPILPLYFCCCVHGASRAAYGARPDASILTLAR